MESVNVGSVVVFKDLDASKAQALKPLEEAAEVFGAWQEWEHGTDEQWSSELLKRFLMGEIADTITACCNLAAALGVTDLTPHLAACEERNRRRGRF